MTFSLTFWIFCRFAVCGQIKKHRKPVVLGALHLVDDTGLEPVTLRTSSGCSSSGANRPFWLLDYSITPRLRMSRVLCEAFLRGRCRERRRMVSAGGRDRAAGRPGAAGASGRSPLRRCGAPPGLRPVAPLPAKICGGTEKIRRGVLRFRRGGVI